MTETEELQLKLDIEKRRTASLIEHCKKLRAEIAESKKTFDEVAEARLRREIDRNAACVRAAVEDAERKRVEREKRQEVRDNKAYKATQKNARSLFYAVAISFLLIAAAVIFCEMDAWYFSLTIAASVCAAWFGWGLNDAVRLMRR